MEEIDGSLILGLPLPNGCFLAFEVGVLGLGHLLYLFLEELVFPSELPDLHRQ